MVGVFYFCHGAPWSMNARQTDAVPGSDGRRIMDAPAGHEARVAAPNIDKTLIKALAQAEAVLVGRLPKGLKPEDLVRQLPSAWAEQRRELLGRRADPPVATRSSGAGPVSPSR